MRADPLVPLEDVEQADLVSWLRDRGIKCFRVPNETYTKSHSQKAKNKRLGVSAGVQDLFVIISPAQSKDGEGYLLPMEMKRIRGSSTSQAQKEWFKTFNGLGLLNVQAYICMGADEAKRIIGHYLNDQTRSIDAF